MPCQHLWAAYHWLHEYNLLFSKEYVRPLPCLRAESTFVKECATKAIVQRSGLQVERQSGVIATTHDTRSRIVIRRGQTRGRPKANLSFSDPW